MAPSSVRALLSRIANDAAFREWLASSPRDALGGYDLSEEEARLFTEGGTAAMALLSWEARGAARPAAAGSPSPAAGQPSSTTVMPPFELILQVSPTAQPGPDGVSQIAHLAALHPSGTAPDALTGACFVLRLSPLASALPDGGMQVHYAAAIDPVGTVSGTDEPDTAVPTAPWGHDTTSPAVQEAADAVLQASEANRYDAILQLIEVMTA